MRKKPEYIDGIEIIDWVLTCPYCGDEKSQDSIGCCGESSDHFEEMPVDEHGEIMEDTGNNEPPKSDYTIYAEENPIK